RGRVGRDAARSRARVVRRGRARGADARRCALRGARRPRRRIGRGRAPARLAAIARPALPRRAGHGAERRTLGIPRPASRPLRGRAAGNGGGRDRPQARRSTRNGGPEMIAALIAALLAPQTSTPPSPAKCEDLATLKLPATTIASAKTTPAATV